MCDQKIDEKRFENLTPAARGHHRKLIAGLAALAMALTACSELDTPADPDGISQQEQPALAESLNTAPTAWWWYYGITPAQLSTIVSSTSGRIVSLQVEQ